ncbi:sulfite exporter TauE/SafE family protein [Cytobacillus massiliigabonensis]|uniref:sulfite exporter TauE/SafE family protein n=1 Tax=Cytobacillus massiliigabonensis TaxID=1871011 RepID=UPI000C860380|nr:TSUP family transporter [Cytobacillus massiliigabonensis]
MKKQTLIFSLVIVFLLLSLGPSLTSISISNTNLIILCFIGIVSSFVGTLAGGGGLITIPAMMLIGIPIQTSIATNKFSSGIAAFSSVFYLIRRKDLHINAIYAEILIACIGGAIGALITSYLSAKTMNMIGLFLLIFALAVTIKNREWINTVQTQKKESPTKRWRSFISFSIAVYDGGFGPGSSTFGIIHNMKQSNTYLKAVQMTRVLIFGSCTGGFIIFYHTGFLQWTYAITMAIGTIIGSQLGLLVLPKISHRTAKILLITILCLLITQMVLKFI